MSKTLAACLAAACVAMVAAKGQGTFQNLDFESAHNLSPLSSSFATSNALPGWSAFAGTNPLTSIAYNWVAGVPTVGLYGSNSFVISGSFSVLLFHGGSLRQTGLVPGNAESLLFKRSGNSPTLLDISLGGQSLSYTAVSSGPDYTLFGSDVSAFAGQTASLTILSPGLDFIDDLEFSPQVIPEPSFLSLLSFGVLLLAVRQFPLRSR
jgi:hypothetical protein